LDILRLRKETEADHLAVEAAFPLLDWRLDRARYVLCLERMYGVVAAWEERAAELAPDWLQPLLLARSRREMLKQDLAWFGVSASEERPALPPMSDLPSLLGTMYVMEGSTLGGQIIARQVAESLALEDGRGSAYFRGHVEKTGAMWKEFCEVLKVQVPENEADAVILSAKAMFLTFGDWMRERSGVDERQ
jgi:heme oxygenase (biliverdin-IX-beta and delta-forming)